MLAQEAVGQTVKPSHVFARLGSFESIHFTSAVDLCSQSGHHMNCVHMINPVVQIHRAMKEHIADARFHNLPNRRVIALRDECLLGRFRLAMLGKGEQQVTRAENRRGARKPNATPPRAPNGQHQKRQAEQWIDDGNEIPRNPIQRKWPPQMRAVTGAGIQEPMRGVPQKTGHPNFTKLKPPPGHQPDQQRHDECSQRNERQRM